MSTRPHATRLLVTRHGESEWNAAGRWQGQADPPLTPRGREQAARAALAARGLVRRVVASDLARAAETGRTIAAHLELGVSYLVELRERDIGPWSGLTTAEVEVGWPGYLAAGRRPEGAELDDPMWERVQRGLRSAAIGEGPVMVVAHGGVIALIERQLGDPRGKVHNLEARWVEVTDAGALVLGSRVLLAGEASASAWPAETDGGRHQPV